MVVAVTEPSEHLRTAYVLLAAVAGGIVSLSTLPWKRMPWDERLMTVAVGAFVGIFAAPWVAVDIMKIDVSHVNTICGITFSSAAAAQALVQPAIKALKNKLGLGDEA